jgi:moderate conductance mechanosensitive channel
VNSTINEWLSHPLVQIVWKIALVVVIFFIVRALGRKLIARAFNRPQTIRASQARLNTLKSLTQNVFSYVLLFIVAMTVLEILGFNLGPILAGAGVVGLAVAFGAQGLVSDVVTGFFLLLERQLEVGDYVSAGGVEGIVEELGFRTTLIRGFDGTLHYVPNRNIANVDNHSRGNMRALVDISIPAGQKIDESLAMVKEALEGFSHPAIVSGPEVLGVESDDLATTTIRVIAKTENMEQWAVEREIRQAIRQRYDALSQSEND